MDEKIIWIRTTYCAINFIYVPYLRETIFTKQSTVQYNSSYTLYKKETKIFCIDCDT